MQEKENKLKDKSRSWEGSNTESKAEFEKQGDRQQC
jgi:hypothetical protein